MRHVWRRQEEPGFDWGMGMLLLPAGLAGLLGVWQVQRYSWKDELVEARAASLQQEPQDIFTLKDYPPEYTRVTCKGRYLHDKSVFIGPRVRQIQGATIKGYVLITPLYNDQHQQGVLINRGWVPDKFKTQRTSRNLMAAQQTAEVEGVVRRSEVGNSWVPPNEPDTGQWFSIKSDEIARYAGLESATPLVEVIDLDGISTWGLQESKKNPLERVAEVRARQQTAASEAGAAYKEEVAPQYPLPGNAEDYMSFSVMPVDHQIYAAIWFLMAAILLGMAAKFMTKPKY